MTSTATSSNTLISSILCRASKRHGKAALPICSHYKQLLSLSILTFLISLGTTLPAQDTIIMPRTGALSVELQPCKEYIILDPGGLSNYPAGCNSAIFLWSSTEEDITIQGRYTVTAIRNAGEQLPTFYAQTLFFDGNILQSRIGTNPIESNMTRTYPSSDDLNSFDSIGESTVMGTISQRAISGYSAIFFQSVSNQPGAEGFVLRVKAGDGSNPSADRLSVSNLSPTSATISWRDLSHNGGTWTLRYDTIPYNLRHSVPASGTSATLTNLRPNTLYYYAVINNLDDPNGDDKGCTSPMSSFITPAVPSSSGCIDFLDLESDYAHCYSGNYANPKVKEGIIDVGSDDINSRHTLITSQTIDPRAFNGQSFLKTIPDGESASIRLGNWQIGAQSECVTYQYTVDTNLFDLLLLKYAVVLQEPNHPFEQQPMFLLSITDEYGNDLNSDCYTAYFVPGLNTEGWNVGNQPNILWKDWSTIGVDLSPLHGRTIYINLITRDCLEAAHYGYAYYVMRCGRKEVEIASCGDNVENTFTLPEGFGYRWYRSDNKSNTLSETRQLHVTSEGTYICDLSFLGANGSSQCNFTMRAFAGPHHPYARFDIEETDQHIDSECKIRALFKNNSIITRDETHLYPTFDEGGTTYQWIIDGTPYIGEPSYFDFTEGTHTVSLIASLSDEACSDTLTRTFHIGGFCPVADPNLSFSFCDTVEPVCIYDTALSQPGVHTIDSANHSRQVTITLHHSITNHISDTVPLTQLPDYSYLGFHFSNSVDTILFRHTHVTADGCDSLLRFSLLVCDNHDTTIYHNVCDNAWPYERDGQSFSSEGHYSYPLPTYCGFDRTLNLHLQEIESYSTDFFDTICQGSSSTVIGTAFSNEGTHTKPMQSRLGCDSIEVLYLVVRPSYDDTDRHTICVGDTLHWIDDNDYTDSVSPAPQQHYLSQYGCDSTITLDLTVSDGSLITQSLFRCDSFSWFGQTYTESTIAEHIDTASTSTCGSTIQLNLTIGHSTTYIDTQEHCDAFTWYGQRFTESTTTPTHRLTNSVGCDSIITLHLTIRNSTSGIDTQIHCDSYRWPHNGVLYTTTNYNYTFYYAYQHPTVHIRNVAGCDSAVTLDLTLLHSSYGIASFVECYNFSWHGREFNHSSDTATYHTRNSVGCDSTVTLRLVILDRVVIRHDTACDRYTWRGVTYYSDTIKHTDGLINYRGCQYSETLILKINHSNQYDDVISACDSFYWHDIRFTSSNNTIHFDTINAAGCDSVTRLRLSIHYSSQHSYYDTICSNQTLSQSGQVLSTEGTHRIPLHDAYGCDSIEYINLKVWPAFSLSDSHAVCRGDTLGWINGIAYTAIDDTTPHINFYSSHGCDSIVSLSLTIYDTAFGSHSIYVPEDSMPTFRYNGASFSGDVQDTAFHLTSAVGCDSILHFTLRVCYNHDTTIRRSVCANKYPFSLHGRYFDTAGTYPYKIHTFCGADSNITLVLSEKPIYLNRFFDTICSNQSFHQSGKTFSTNGTHNIKLRTRANCDSIEEIHLKVWPTFTQYDRRSICRGDTLLWEENGQFYTDVPSPAPDTTYASVHGCDSTRILSLTVHEHSYNYINTTVLENNLPSFRFNNVAFDTDIADTLFLFSNSFGCDSFLHFSLHVARNHDTTLHLSICSGKPATFVINGTRNTFRTEDTTLFQISTHEGADSTIIIISAFYENSEITVYDTICDAIQNGLGNSEILRQRRDIGQTTHLCDSITKILTTVRPINISNYTEVVPENDLPHTYHYATFSDDVSDSVFRLANRWECDSLVHYTMIVCRNTDTAIYDTICDYQTPHLWNGVSFTASSTKHTIISTHCGSDSSLTMHLHVKNSSFADDVFSACDSFEWHGRRFTSSNQTDTILNTNSIGCDSVTTLRLSMYYSYLNTYHDTICDNQTFSQSGQTFNTEGTYVIPLTSIHNCDSIENIYLKVWPTLTSIDSISICRGDTLLWQDGKRYTDTLQPAPNNLLSTQHSCDSTITLSLTIRGAPSYSTDSVMITENELPTYRYNNAAFASDVSDTVFRLINAANCDSILHFTLSVCRNVDSAIQRNVCDDALPLYWHDTVFVEGGTIALHRINHCGADSTVILLVHVHPAYNITRYDTICDNQQLLWDSQTLTTAGTYGIYRQSIYGCDSNERLHLTVCPTYDTTDHIILCWGTTLHWIDGNDYTYRPLDQPIAYLQSQYGCDSIVTLDILKTHPLSGDLTVNPEHPTWENPEIQLNDISRNNSRRQWYLSGQFLDTSKTLTYRFDTPSDTVETIKLIVFDDYGCTDTLTRRIHFDRSGLWVPNLITPNRLDNNVMRIAGVGINELECYVYTRQGQFIYKFNSINDVWDGTYNGTLCPQATYTYVIHYTTIHDPKSWLTKKGTVTLLR
ncbi:MAG: gliding motility-associated C-terminal domain-containing protein [Bacteroidales bacterium]|nr:gliding motility-associated C-terminal domain-containing protein [Bacteroidales bacterium]